MFGYCTQVLGLSEQAAYSRITAARAVARVPAMLPMLQEGTLTLSSVGLLAPHLTEENQEPLLAAAQNQSTRQVELLIACLHPQPDLKSSVRARPGRAEIAPLSGQTYWLKVTIREDTHNKLMRARDLLRHAVPSGDPAEILDRALTLLVNELVRSKTASTSRPRPSRESSPPTGRYIPAHVRRAVWQRDEGKCAFVGSMCRCEKTAFLEFHHVVPFCAGGPATIENIQLRCRRHNAHEARVFDRLEGLMVVAAS
jgi:5-methylcytosine-specific restriction endonuclease McrA